MAFLDNLKGKMGDLFGGSDDDFAGESGGQEYVELANDVPRPGKGKIIVRPFIIEDFTDVKGILESLREGTTIALVNIKPLKDKDLIELKRAINKLKKTTDAIEGDIAGFGDDYVVVTPSFATVYRGPSTANAEEADRASREMSEADF